LNDSDPAHAALADRYVETQRLSMAKALKHPWSPETTARLGAHHFPDTVEFVKMAPGQYMVSIKSNAGIELCNLVISQPS
jgi:hypothetical protein